MTNGTYYRYGIQNSLLPGETTIPKPGKHKHTSTGTATSSFPKKILTLLQIKNNNELRRSIDGLYKDNGLVKALRFDDSAELQGFLGSLDGEFGVVGGDGDGVKDGDGDGDGDLKTGRIRKGDDDGNGDDDGDGDGDGDDDDGVGVKEVVVDVVEKYEDLDDFSNFIGGAGGGDDDGAEDPVVKKGLTVSCSGLPDFVIQSNKMIESLLNYVVCDLVCGLMKIKRKVKTDGDGDDAEQQEEDVAVNVNYNWSFIESEYYIESKVLYVCFSDVLTLFLVKRLLNGFKIELSQDKDSKNEPITFKLNISSSNDIEFAFGKLENFFEIDSLNDDKRIEELRNLVIKRFQLLYNIFNSNKELFEQDVSKIKLDDIAKMYRDYKVDPKELVDVPPDMVENVKQRIIEFRLHAIKVEDNKKSLQLLNDKKRSKMKLKRLFKDLHGHNSKKKNEHSDMDIDSDEEEEDDDETENIDDEEYEKLKEVQNKESIERNAYQRLQQAKQREIERVRKYKIFHRSVEHEAYINSYIPETRKKNLRSFVNDVSDANNKIDSSFNYYVNHSNWLAHRQKKKLEEEKLDEADRIEEENETKAQNEAKAFTESISGGLGTGTKLKISLKRKVKETENSDEEETSSKRRK